MLIADGSDRCFLGAGDEFANWAAFLGENADGAFGLVADVAGGVDAEVVVDGGKDIAIVDGPFGGVGPDFVGGADDLSGRHTAAGEEYGLDGGPVIAAGFVVDFGSATEFAPDDEGDILIESALGEVLDESGDPGVEGGEMRAAVSEVVSVCVPESVGDGDDTDAGFDKSAGDEQLVVPERCAVAEVFGGAAAVEVEDSGVFVFDVHGVDELR